MDYIFRAQCLNTIRKTGAKQLRLFVILFRCYYLLSISKPIKSHVAKLVYTIA